MAVIVSVSRDIGDKADLSKLGLSPKAMCTIVTHLCKLHRISGGDEGVRPKSVKSDRSHIDKI